MKSIISVILAVLFNATLLLAQTEKPNEKKAPEKSDKEQKIEQSIAKIKKEIESMKGNIDSSQLREMANILEKSAEEIANALEKLADETEDIADQLEEKADIDKESAEADHDAAEVEKDSYKSHKKDLKGKKESKHKSARRTKMMMDLSLGLTGLVNNTETVNPSAVYPDYKPWSSNFYDVGLKFKTRIGGPGSRVGVTYGLTYLWNNLDFSNDVKIQMNNNEPSFVVVDNAVKSTELNIGYLTIPIGAELRIGKKGKFGVGAYGGYRVRSVQKIRTKNGDEDISEKRIGNYGLNNTMYGVSAKVGYGNLVLVGRYNLSNVFKENKQEYAYNPYNIGINFGF